MNRLSQDLDVATENPASMDDIVRTVSGGLTQRGWDIRQIEANPLSGRLIATDPDTGEECEVGILKEAFWSPPVATEYGPVLGLDDVIGTKVRALADRGAVRDLIDVHSAGLGVCLDGSVSKVVVTGIPSCAGLPVGLHGCGGRGSCSRA